MLGRSGAGGLALLVGVALTVAACGTSHPPPAGDGNSGSSPSAAPQLGAGDAGARLPGCGVKDDGTACNCIDVPLFADPPNV
ncbi:MAG: hypothetical protein JWO86_9093 [Myxococcaceae bacterium]|nr:hypothetical protein [Myxococcaceae bacterium]